MTQESEQLKLYLSSLIRLLATRGVLPKEEVAAFVSLIDAE